MLASELIARALRLINVPGRGASLAAEDQQAAFEALTEILDSKAVTKQFVPGITRHYFELTAGKAIYSYGPGAYDFNSRRFDDPSPIRVEDAYIRQGSSVISNNIISNPDFNRGAPSWITTPTAPDPIPVVQNGQGEFRGLGLISQANITALISDKTWILKTKVTIASGSVTLRVIQDFPISVVEFETVLDSSGIYEFTINSSSLWIFPILQFISDSSDTFAFIDYCYVVEEGLERYALPDAPASDYPVKIIDQTRYNNQFTKGSPGRPYQMLFSRGYPANEIRFDNAPSAGDVLVMDVTVNTIQVTDVEDELRVNGETVMWLRYKLADVLSAEYGKGLTRRQLQIMDDAWNTLASANRRINRLGVDHGLRKAIHYNINRGDS